MGQWLVDRQDVCPRRRSARHTRGANLEAGWPEWDRTPAGQSGPGRRDHLGTLARMPTFQIVTGALDAEGRCRLAREISRAAAEVGQPIDHVTVMFVEPQAVFVKGGEQIPPARFARVDVTIGGLDEAQRRALGRAVGGLLCDAGVREDAMTLIFHDVRGPQVALGRGTFPFWPEAEAVETITGG